MMRQRFLLMSSQLLEEKLLEIGWKLIEICKGKGKQAVKNVGNE
jgi:hypothetical protein